MLISINSPDSCLIPSNRKTSLRFGSLKSLSIPSNHETSLCSGSSGVTPHTIFVAGSGRELLFYAILKLSGIGNRDYLSLFSIAAIYLSAGKSASLVLTDPVAASISKYIIEKSRGEVSLMEQDTIGNVS